MDLSETRGLIYQINLRNSASRWLSLQEYRAEHWELKKVTWWESVYRDYAAGGKKLGSYRGWIQF